MKIHAVSGRSTLLLEDSTAPSTVPTVLGGKSLYRKRLFFGMALAVSLHAAAIFLSRESPGVSALFVLLFSLAAAGACYRRSTQTSGLVPRKWDFLASALSLWSIGEATYALRLFFPGLGRVHVLGPEFYFLVYGIPVLLAISTSNEERDSVLFVVIDSLQAIFAVILVYVDISVLQVGATAAPNLTNLYAAGAWILATATLLRLLAHPRGEEKTLYRILFLYLIVFALLALPWQRRSIFNALPLGQYRDLLADFTFLILFGGCLLVRKHPEPEDTVVETNTFALVLNNGSPILFTLAVLGLGALIARIHFGFGIAAISLSLLLYCFRAALLQSAYLRAQHELTRSQYALREANSRLKQLSLHDALTRLPNRRLFDQTLESEWNRAQRNRRPLSVLIIDVDCFKTLNDLYGHPTGDECLSRIAAALHGTLRRAGEVVARYGGEEFVAILPDIDADGAARIAEAMREAVFALRIANKGSVVGPFVTASFGVATIEPDEVSSPSALVAAADGALYCAKRNGRNRIAVAASSRAEVQVP
jgi:diguanylate cyclase (GGDEF)-like protein